MYTDPIADLLTRIRNANLARQEHAVIPYSKSKESIVKVLADNGFIGGYEVINADKVTEKALKVEILYNRPVLKLKRVSKPGQRIYKGSSEMREVRSGIGIDIVTTSQGVMTGKEAKEKNIGGEVLCTVY